MKRIDLTKGRATEHDYAHVVSCAIVVAIALIWLGVADAVLAAELCDRYVSLMLLQKADELFDRETIAHGSLVLSIARAYFNFD